MEPEINGLGESIPCGMMFARFNRKCPTKYVRACLTSHADAVV